MIDVTSDVVREGERLPPEHTEKGRDVSPPLRWRNVPEGTRSQAVLLEAVGGDPVHWILYGLPPDLRGLDAHVAPEESTPDGPRPGAARKQGRNGFGKIGYQGPRRDAPGEYVFTVFAYDSVPQLPAGATKEDLVRVTHGHVLDHGHLVTRFGG